MRDETRKPNSTPPTAKAESPTSSTSPVDFSRPGWGNRLLKEGLEKHRQKVAEQAAKK